MMSDLAERGAILGFQAVVDREHVAEHPVSALIEVKLTPERDGGFDRMARRIARFDQYIALYEKLGQENPELLIKAASRLRGMANYRTNFQIISVKALAGKFIFFFPIILTILFHLLISLYLLKKTIDNTFDILYISDVISGGYKNAIQAQFVLDFNHCRFLKKFSFEKDFKNEDQSYKFMEYFKSFNLNFFFSGFYYVLSLFIPLMFSIDLLS